MGYVRVDICTVRGIVERYPALLFFPGPGCTDDNEKVLSDILPATRTTFVISFQQTVSMHQPHEHHDDCLVDGVIWLNGRPRGEKGSELKRNRVRRIPLVFGHKVNVTLCRPLVQMTHERSDLIPRFPLGHQDRNERMTQRMVVARRRSILVRSCAEPEPSATTSHAWPGNRTHRQPSVSWPPHPGASWPGIPRRASQ